MFEIKRRRLGPVYTTAPAQDLYKWILDNTRNFVFTIICCLAWMVVLYVCCGIFTFLTVQLANDGHSPLTTGEVYKLPLTFAIMIIGYVLIALHVFSKKGK